MRLHVIDAIDYADNSTALSYSLPAFTPPAYSLLVLFAFGCTAPSTNIGEGVTNSGTGFTWTRRGISAHNGDKLCCYTAATGIAFDAAPSSTVVTWTAPDPSFGSTTGAILSLVCIVGHQPATSVATYGQNSGTSSTPSLTTSAGSAANLSVVACATKNQWYGLSGLTDLAPSDPWVAYSSRSFSPPSLNATVWAQQGGYTGTTLSGTLDGSTEWMMGHLVVRPSLTKITKTCIAG